MPVTPVGADDGDEDPRIGGDLDAVLRAIRNPAIEQAIASLRNPALHAVIANMQAPGMRAAVAAMRNPGFEAVISSLRSPAMEAVLAQLPTPALDAAFERLRSPSMEALLAQSSAPALDAVFERLRSPAVEALLTRNPTVEAALAQSASFFASVNAAELLQKESAALLADPTTWVAETEAAAEDGDDHANRAWLLVRYLYGCFWLLARQLDPSARTLERYGPVLAWLTIFVIAAGTLNAADPQALAALNNLLTTPVGIVSVYLAARSLPDGRPKKHKRSKKTSGGSKPSKKALKRARGK